MKISEIGGEFELIKRLTKGQIINPSVIKGVGDDCAVLDYCADKYILVTTDMMVENDHFNTKWSTPFQIGMKLIEVNVSDIVSMAGTPKFAFVSMSLTKNTSVEFMDELYKGMNESCKRHGVSILGGDTTHGKELVFNLSLIGEVDKKIIKYRAGAKQGDLICVTGNLGGSTAGLRLLLNGREGYLIDHLEPKSRLASEGEAISKYANSMIDVSDGLASEVKHICEESEVGGRIEYDNIPLSQDTVNSASTVGEDAIDFALYGGEDFELVFTVPEDSIEDLRREFSDFAIVGKVVDKSRGVFLIRDKEEIPLKAGYSHFA